MKIKITTPVTNYKNEIIKEKDEKGVERESTWRDVVFTALNNLGRDEQLTSESKQQCYQLTNKIYSNDEIDLTVEQVAFILGRIDKIYVSPMIVGKSKEFFDPKPAK